LTSVKKLVILIGKEKIALNQGLFFYGPI